MSTIQYQVTNKEPQYDVEEQIDKLLKNEGKELPSIHNVFLCRDGDFYSDEEPGAEHHDDTVRRIGYLADMKFSDNEDIDTDTIHEFMFRTGIIRGHRFAEVPQYDFDIVFPPTQDQVQTMTQMAASHPEIDIGYAIGTNSKVAQYFGRGIDNLISTLARAFPPDIDNPNKFVIQGKNEQGSIEITEYKPNEGLFIRSFFADNSFNKNNWGVTQEALNRDIATGVEKAYFGKTAPMIDTPDDSHPPDDVEDMVSAQEPHRKGDFLRTGIDPVSKRAYVDAIVRDPETIKRIQSGDLNYVSPSIHALSAITTGDGRTVVTKFRINHLAFVKRPAFGEMKAQIKGRCVGTAEQCLPILSNVQASFTTQLMPCGGLDLHIPAKYVSASMKEMIKQGKDMPMRMVSDTMWPPEPCKVCGQPLLEHNANSSHQYEKNLEGGSPGHAEDPYRCSMCGHRFSTEKALNDHKEMSSKTPNHMNFKSEDNTEQINDKKNQTFFERNSKNPILVGSEIKYICQDCGYNETNENLMQKHKMENRHSLVTRDQFYANYDADDSCVSGWIPELKKAHPDWKQDQVVAVAFSKCKSGEHHKSANIQHLKAKINQKQSMSSTETDEEKKKREQLEKDKHEQAEQIKKYEADLKAQKEQLDFLNAELKTPIVSKIVQARIKAGTLKQADVSATTETLMKHDISYLKSLNADLEAIQATAEKMQTPGQVKTRFTYVASTRDENKDAMAIAKEIRSRMR